LVLDRTHARGLLFLIATALTLASASATASAGARIGAVASAAGENVPLVPVESGRWNGEKWTLLAGDARHSAVFTDISLRMTFVAKKARARLGSEIGGAVGDFTNPNVDAPRYAIMEIQGSKCPAFQYVIGAVPATTALVTIRTTAGATVRTRTVAPPHGLLPNIGFFAAQTPCSGKPSAIVGTDKSGRIVAHVSGRYIH
jgi:hypothetical protein